MRGRLSTCSRHRSTSQGWQTRGEAGGQMIVALQVYFWGLGAVTFLSPS